MAKGAGNVTKPDLGPPYPYRPGRIRVRLCFSGERRPASTSNRAAAKTGDRPSVVDFGLVQAAEERSITMNSNPASAKTGRCTS